MEQQQGEARGVEFKKSRTRKSILRSRTEDTETKPYRFVKQKPHQHIKATPHTEGPRQTKSALLREEALKKKLIQRESSNSVVRNGKNNRTNENSRSSRYETSRYNQKDSLIDETIRGKVERKQSKMKGNSSTTYSENRCTQSGIEKHKKTLGYSVVSKDTEHDFNNKTKFGTSKLYRKGSTISSATPVVANVESVVLNQHERGTIRNLNHKLKAGAATAVKVEDSDELMNPIEFSVKSSTLRTERKSTSTRFWKKIKGSSAMDDDEDSITNENLILTPREISIVSPSHDSDEQSRPEERLPIVINPDSLPYQTSLTEKTPTQKFPNLNLDLASCAWENLHQQLDFLTHNRELVIPTLAAIHPADGSTPLHTAAWKAPSILALSIIRLLPPTDAGDRIFVTVDMDGNTPLHLCCANLSPFYDSNTAKTSFPFLDLSVLELLLQKAPQALEIQNDEGDTPLHLFVGSPAACYSDTYTETSSLKALSIILDHLPSPETALSQDMTGASSLHLAVANHANKLILAKLLDAAPDACKAEDEHGMLPLHYVAAYLNAPAPIVKKMLDIYPNGAYHKTENGDTALHLVVRNTANSPGELANIFFRTFDSTKQLDSNIKDIVSFFMDENSTQDISPLLIANREKLTPLHCCALFNAPTNITRLLMKHPHALRAASMQNAFGATALHLAVAQQAAGTFVDTALAVGTPEAAVVQDKLRRTPIHVAAQNIHATRQLIDSLVKLNPLACTKKTERGHLPLHLAAQSQAKEHVIDALISAYPAGAEVKNKSNNTPLHDAAKYRASAGVVELLLKEYPEAVYIQNKYGNLPLHCACAYQAPSHVVGLLLKAWPHGASIQNRNEDCPLHYAAVYATNIDALKKLVDAAPSSVLLLNRNGQSPIAKAKANDAPEEIIEMLQRGGEDWTRKALEDGWGDFS